MPSLLSLSLMLETTVSIAAPHLRRSGFLPLLHPLQTIHSKDDQLSVIQIGSYVFFCCQVIEENLNYRVSVSHLATDVKEMRNFEEDHVSKLHKGDWKLRDA